MGRRRKAIARREKRSSWWSFGAVVVGVAEAWRPRRFDVEVVDASMASKLFSVTFEGSRVVALVSVMFELRFGVAVEWRRRLSWMAVHTIRRSAEAA